VEHRPDHCHHQHRHHWRPDVLHRHLLGGINSGDEPDDQGTDGGDSSGDGDTDEGPEVEAGKQFDFTSYSADGETEYAQGVAAQTGEKRKTGDDWFVEVEVTENSVADWVGRKFWIAATATADGTTKYPLYDADGNAAGVTVTITAKA